ncbi:hypothetical protein EDC04DRAFT_2641310 [Pisolithus marmoratus]|nr:hypothetical protein EDC04DRAFT_2641310 [Pisolithus marmoratus]
MSALVTCTSGSNLTYIYKLVSHTSSTPSSVKDFPERLPVSSIDESSGFLHFSTAKQVPNTLKYFFGADPHVYILRVPYAKVEKDIRWEDPKAEVCGPRGGEGMFPHLYNGLKLGKEEVESVSVLYRQADSDEGGEWDAALQESANWLIY